jgi:uncharacterized delta-60 repeat protein
MLSGVLAPTQCPHHNRILVCDLLLRTIAQYETTPRVLFWAPFMTQGLANLLFRGARTHSARPALFLAWLLANIGGIASAVPLAIDYQPQNQTIILCQPASFSVIASGTPPLKYQWYKGGARIPGATKDQILFPQTHFSDAGLYSVLVSNDEGALLSADARLTINPPRHGDVDYTFMSGGSINGPVLSVALTPDGRILVAGAFSTVYRASRGGIARLMADGATDQTFASDAPTSGVFSSVAVQNDGKILLGGYFTTVHGVDRASIARLNVDGTVDTDFQNRLGGANSSVNAIAIQGDGKTLIAGDFTAVNDFACNRIARLNADGTVDTSFLNGLEGADNSITSIALQSDGKVLIGGYFTTVNFESRNAIARLHADGTLDSDFIDPLFGVNNCVHSIAVQDDGKIIIAGDFGAVDEFSCNHIARLNPDGSLDTAFQTSLSGVNESIQALALQTDGKILIGGYFTTIDGHARNYIARLHADGTLDTAFQDSLSGANYYVRSVAVQGDGSILIAGLFTVVNGTSRNFVARLHADGSLDPAFQHESLGADNFVRSVAVQRDGGVLIGGRFASVSGHKRNSIARLHPNGALDTSFQNELSGANESVQSIAVQRDSRILIAGDFTVVNGEIRNHIARLNFDGTLDRTFQNGLPGANNSIFCVAEQSDGKILIGGRFIAVNDSESYYIGRLNADGTFDTTFQEGLPGPNDSVTCIALQKDGRILIGGYFNEINGVERVHLARLHPNGSLDTGFLDRLSGPNGLVCSLAIQSNGKILIGGWFTSVNGKDRNYIARLQSDGALDNTFQLGFSGANNFVKSVAVQRDGRVLIGGHFTEINGVPRNFIARLHADGSLDTTFQHGLAGANSGVESVVLQGDGNVLIGGFFSIVNGAPAASVARLWRNQPSIEEVAPPRGGTTTLTVRLVPGTMNRVQYKNSLHDPVWIDLPGDLTANEPNGLIDKLDAQYPGRQRFYRVLLLP